MLLPSDVARLVLGYLQQEKLLATCRAFILESSDLKEYAEHCTGEGFVPACLLSLFGKNLITILNEYIAMKSKEATNDVPAMMSSLWKKLDYTLSQIRSMQNSGGFSAHQRSRTRSAIADMKKQKCLQQSASSNNLGSSSVLHQPGQLNSTAVTATQVILKPIITSSLVQARQNSSSALQGQIQESQINTGDSLTLVSAFQERKLNSGVLSPGKRKSDSQKKRSTASSGPQLSNHSLRDSPIMEKESSPIEEENEQLELIDGDLPQMIIQNAREKILSNKCLQEKLAENINKFLGSDGNISQMTKQAESGPAIQESSIDEFLGLQQGEIHMTEEAIQEILEQTESDPAFQGLFDIFDFGKTKGCRNASQGIHMQNGAENAILVDEENLESYIGTKELGDNSQESLSYTDDHSKEASVLKTVCGSDATLEEHMQTIATGEFPVCSEVRNENETVETETSDQTIKQKTTYESGQNRVLGTEFSVHNVNSYNRQGIAATRDYRTDKDLVCQDVQNLSDLQYNQLDISQTALSDRVECCSLSKHILSEKTSAKLPTPLKSDEGETLNKISVLNSSQTAKNLEQVTNETSIFPVPSQQNPNSPTSSDCQGSDKLESESATALVVDASSPTVVELQLEVVDTSNSLILNDPTMNPDSCSKTGNQKMEDSEITQVEMQEPSSTKADVDCLFLTSDTETTGTNPNTSTVCHSPLTDPSGESSPGNKVAGSVSSSNQGTSADPSNIVSLKIIISDDPFISADTELNNAVSSITGENMPTIILSSPAKSPAKVIGTSKGIASEESERPGDSALIEQNLLVLRTQDSITNTVNIPNEDCAVFSIAGANNIAKNGEFIQLMPATSTSFGNSNGVYIASCLTEPTPLNTVTPSNLVVFPGNSTSLASQTPVPQPLRTPPRTNNLFAMNPPISPNFSQGSAIIIASPVQPVLQGMVGMIPVSIMGQSGNTFSDPSRQILHIPVQTSLSSGVIPKLPLPPKSQRMSRNKPNAGKTVVNGSEPVNHLGSQIQRIGSSDMNVCVDLKKKLETVPADTTSSSSKQNLSHRRVLYFDSTSAPSTGSTKALQKEKNETPVISENSTSTVLSSAKTQPGKRERERTLPRILCKPDITGKNLVRKESQLERKSLDPGLASDVLRKQTANKENELERIVDKASQNQEVAGLTNGQQSLHHEKNSSSAQELTKKQGLQPNAGSKNLGVLTSKESKKEQTKSSSQVHSLTSPLTKQAVEMLYDIQRHSPTSKLPENGELPVPRTPSGTGDRLSDDTFDIIRTPTCRRYSEESTTPRIMVPPATPDLPACSPASETGSENSVSMAAHTLMILSRAAIARTTSTTTPLKDNTQQFRSLRSAAKKRKQEDLAECERNCRTTCKKDIQNFTVPIKKKKIKKKLPIAFPAEMDVDKFLLSLHYDE